MTFEKEEQHDNYELALRYYETISNENLLRNEQLFEIDFKSFLKVAQFEETSFQSLLNKEMDVSQRDLSKESALQAILQSKDMEKAHCGENESVRAHFAPVEELLDHFAPVEELLDHFAPVEELLDHSLSEMIENLEINQDMLRRRTNTLNSHSTGYSFLDIYKDDDAESNDPKGTLEGSKKEIETIPIQNLKDFSSELIVNPHLKESTEKINVDPLAGSIKLSSSTYNSEFHNPFIPKIQNKSGPSPVSLMPKQVPFNHTVQDSPHKQLIVDANEIQQQAQRFILGIDVTQQEGQYSHRRIPPRTDASGISLKDESALSLSRKSVRRSSYDSNLTSIGKVYVNPRFKANATAIDAVKIPIQSFTTPAHQKATPSRRKITQITAPTLISTSSFMKTIPLKKIWEDLKMKHN